ncbi:hypothetical protein KFU94_05450 [Chloroflexi bacterium TSY]|nr:hypothetical protein [Chloroflexi bacterium TSY]
MTQAKQIGLALSAVALWILSTLISIYEILLVRDIVLSIYTLFASRDTPLQAYGRSYWNSVTISNFTVATMAILVVVVFVGTGEYHYRHWGTRKSWRLFGWTFGIQAILLLIGYYL